MTSVGISETFVLVKLATAAAGLQLDTASPASSISMHVIPIGAVHPFCAYLALVGKKFAQYTYNSRQFTICLQALKQCETDSTS
jgi:hypothetical protein